jgi:hypothetical protein
MRPKGILEMPRARRWLVASLATLLFSFGQGCSRDRSDRHVRARAKNYLMDLCKAICVLEGESGKRIAPDAPSLIAAFEANGILEWLKIDRGAREIRDAWGSPIIILSAEGRIIALGSAGPDGSWERGGRDDILVLMPDVRQSRPTSTSSRGANAPAPAE